MRRPKPPLLNRRELYFGIDGNRPHRASLAHRAPHPLAADPPAGARLPGYPRAPREFLLERVRAHRSAVRLILQADEQPPGLSLLGHARGLARLRRASRHISRRDPCLLRTLRHLNSTGSPDTEEATRLCVLAGR